MRNINKIYLHWTAAPGKWLERGHYHTVIWDDCSVHRLHDISDASPAHTYHRNSDSIGIGVNCMAGGNWDLHGPTDKQITTMCDEVVKLVRALGWFTLEVVKSLNRDALANRLANKVMTHAEAAALRDFPLATALQVSSASGLGVKARIVRAEKMGLPHDNYGPTGWADGWPDGTYEKWDFFMLKKNNKPGSGGHDIRIRILDKLLNG